jgi:hypothetical protein
MMEDSMTQREPSAAAALYGHLKTGTPDVVQRKRDSVSVADAVYGHLRPPQPKPSVNRWREAAARARAAWGEANERAWGGGRDQTNKS